MDKIKAAGGNAVTYVYPGEGHAFMNAQSDSIERMKSGLLIRLNCLSSFTCHTVFGLHTLL